MQPDQARGVENFEESLQFENHNLRVEANNGKENVVKHIIFDQSNISEREGQLGFAVAAEGTQVPSSQFVSAMSLNWNAEAQPSERT